jgi:tRNA 2-thiocytidine biosynthesis protein TtcA
VTDLMLPKALERKFWRGVIEFGLLEPNDRILIGLSGGKDSIFLCYVLSKFRKNLPFPLEIAAITIDPGFSTTFDTTALSRICEEFGIDFHLRKTQIAEIIKNSKDNPCAQCAFFRRGVINDFARTHGFNKLALAHHLDDAVHTFLLSILHSGKLETMRPKVFQDRSGITVIRPLIYFREKDIERNVKLYGFQPISTGCPVSGKSNRSRIKEIVNEISKEYPDVIGKVVAAMREGAPTSVWPPKLTREEMWQKYQAFWYKSNDS